MPPVELTGTGLVLVLCFVFRNLPVGVRAGTAAFKQLDRSLDEASQMLRASTLTTLRRVVLPLLKPALVAALEARFPGFSQSLEAGMAVAIDGEIYQTPLLEPISPDSEVHFLPLIGGG